MTTLIDVRGGQIELIVRGSGVPEARRDELLDRINRVIATNWRSSKSTWWSREHSPFHDDFGMALFHAGDQTLGYFIYQQLSLDGVPVFYGAGTAVVASQHGRNLYPTLQAHAMAAAWRALEPTPDQVYVAWRTRNPAIWISNSRYCKAVTPSLRDGEDDPVLQDACLRLAHTMYPGCPIESPSMVMHNVFDDLVELRPPRRYPDGSVGARLTEMLANPSDAIFSLGIVDRSVFHDFARRASASTSPTGPESTP